MSSNTLAISELEGINDNSEIVDNTQLNQFIRKYQKFVYHTALRYTNDYDLSEDITQDVFIKAIENINKFKHKSSIKTWLYRITINECKNQLRKSKYFKFLNYFKNSDEEQDEQDNIIFTNVNPENQLIANETEQLFLNAYKELPERQRETFALRYFEELSYEEISEILGTSVGGLKANFYQAIRKIAKRLNVNLGDKNEK